MAPSLLQQEFNQVVNEAKDKVSDNYAALCLIHHINNNTRISLTELKATVDKCRDANVNKNDLRTTLELLAVLGVINMYLNNTYDLTNIGKRVLEHIGPDPFSKKK